MLHEIIVAGLSLLTGRYDEVALGGQYCEGCR
jgi:hypothetical protein